MEEKFKKDLADLIAAHGLEFSCPPEEIADYMLQNALAAYGPETACTSSSSCEWDDSGC